jgi:hypothetical protein
MHPTIFTSCFFLYHLPFLFMNILPPPPSFWAITNYTNSCLLTTAYSTCTPPPHQIPSLTALGFQVPVRYHAIPLLSFLLHYTTYSCHPPPTCFAVLRITRRYACMLIHALCGTLLIFGISHSQRPDCCTYIFIRLCV